MTEINTTDWNNLKSFCSGTELDDDMVNIHAKVAEAVEAGIITADQARPMAIARLNAELKG